MDAVTSARDGCDGYDGSDEPSAVRHSKGDKVAVWSCETCTLYNAMSRESCKACQQPRRHHTRRKVEKNIVALWTCGRCTLVNSNACHQCEACETPRKVEIDEEKDTDAEDVSIKSAKIEKSKQREESVKASHSFSKHIKWNCEHCSFENRKAITACDKCGMRAGWYLQYLKEGNI